MKTKNLAMSIILGLLVLALWWTMLLKPTRAKVAKAKTDAQAQEAKLAPLQTQLAQARRDASHAAEFKAQLREPGPWRITLQGYCECLPRHENFVELDPEPLRIAAHTGADLGGVFPDATREYECVEAAKPDADRRQISLTLRRESEASLAADPMRLAQLMDNVVSNAIKFTPTGGRVTVTAGSHDGQAVFAVSDTGPGISPADQAHLFDPFFRTRAAQTQGIKGTGLGLTITKAIVDAHHGSIEVESSPGTGTTFHIELPLAR